MCSYFEGWRCQIKIRIFVVCVLWYRKCKWLEMANILCCVLLLKFGDPVVQYFKTHHFCWGCMHVLWSVKSSFIILTFTQPLSEENQVSITHFQEKLIAPFFNCVQSTHSWGWEQKVALKCKYWKKDEHRHWDVTVQCGRLVVTIHFRQKGVLEGSVTMMKISISHKRKIYQLR